MLFIEQQKIKPREVLRAHRYAALAAADRVHGPFDARYRIWPLMNAHAALYRMLVRGC